MKDGVLASSLVEFPDSTLITVFDNNKHHEYMNITSRIPQGVMESIYTDLALYGSKNECARTDTVF